jgi:hypothetical protein
MRHEALQLTPRSGESALNRLFTAEAPAHQHVAGPGEQVAVESETMPPDGSGFGHVLVRWNLEAGEAVGCRRSHGRVL